MGNVTPEIVSSLSYDCFELMTSLVPVVVLFTKFDALLPVAFVRLDRRLPLQELLSKAKPVVEDIFNEAGIWGRLSRLKYPPKAYVQIAGLYCGLSYTSWGVPLTNILGMHKSNEGCNNLLDSTAAVLGEEALQMLFVSAQETNVLLCLKYVAER